MFWPGTLITEHKSRGKDLDRAFSQAMDYFPGLSDAQLPRYVVVSDFARFRIHDLETGEETEFPLEALPDHVQSFGFIAGYEARTFKEQDPVNIKAAERLAKLHDGLRDIGYAGHDLEVYLVRLLFCMFAEDTGIFLPRGCFQDFIEQRTGEDGSDLGARLSELFDVLNTPVPKRLRVRDAQLAEFPYVNGRLFDERLRTAAFDSGLRRTLLECCELDWGQVSPAIFGSLFQAIMDKDARRNLGAHYTSEQNILKVIRPLFLDDLYAEFERLKEDKSTQRNARLRRFHEKLAGLNLFDPACGCGNFLVISYRELRLLELAVLRELYLAPGGVQLALDAIAAHVKVDVDQFHGIEIEEWPAQIAQVAMWLIDHQMNIAVSKEFGDAYVRIPLVKSANIVHRNALQLDWNEVLPAERCSYLLGNPPFVGGKYMSPEQRADHRRVHAGNANAGLLDFVTGWYVLAAQYMQLNPSVEAALVSTNSISQGEQVAALWAPLLDSGVRINFAHRTFQWRSESRGAAAVHCVIIGFGLKDRPRKRLFEYEHERGEPLERAVQAINPYLVDGPDLLVGRRNRPLCPVPPIGIGNKPIDGGHYLFSDEEKVAFLAVEPRAEPLFHPWYGAREFINGEHRWCLKVVGVEPGQLRALPEVMKRIEAVRRVRQNSPSAPTKKLADTPTRFHVENFPESDYLVIPKVSSERRFYIPIGYFTPKIMASDLLMVIPDATAFHFGVLTSWMHNAWMRATAGRLKSDYRYSANIVYNNFPWPEPSGTQRDRIEACAQQILAARAAHSGATLADLYDPLTMPGDLRKAHTENDRAVDAAYGRRKFHSEAERVAFLLSLYQVLADSSSQGSSVEPA